MTDVLKIALDRRSRLQEEVAKLDDFIRMAESLLRTPGAAAQVPSASASMSGAGTPVPTRASMAADEGAMQPELRRSAEIEPKGAPDVPRPSIIRRGIATS